MITLIGKNTDFKVTLSHGIYTVYYKGKFLIGNKHKYIDIQSYLN